MKKEEETEQRGLLQHHMFDPSGAKIHMHHGRDVVSVLHDLRYSVLGHRLHEGSPPHAR